MDSWKNSLVVIVGWFLYSLVLIWMWGYIAVALNPVIVWAAEDLNEFQFQTFFFLIDFIANVLLVLPFTYILARYVTRISLWPTVAIAVCVNFFWQYRLVIFSISQLVAFFSNFQAVVGAFTVLFLLPITLIFFRLTRSEQTI